jgi:glycosyltransferase involved in cell wall biosynthesis
MSCGAPVIAANTSSIPEVVQDAGALFNPESAEDLAEQLLFLINHPSQREVLIEKGYKRASYFSWNRAVAQTIEVYRQVLSL